MFTSSISMLWNAVPLAMEAYSGSVRYGVPTMAEGPDLPRSRNVLTTVLADSVVEPFSVTPAKSRQRYLAQSTTSGERSS